MGLRLTVPGADYEQNAIAYTPAISDGLQGLFFLNSSLELAARNLAPGRERSRIIGAPEVRPNSVRCKGLVNYFETDIDETVDMTILVVAASPDTLVDNDHRPMYVANFGSASTTPYIGYGVSLYNTSATALTLGASRYTAGGTGGSSAAVTANNVAPETMSFMSARVRSDRTQVDNLTQSKTANISTALGRYLSRGKMRIGSGYATFRGMADIGFVAAYNRYISDDEQDAMYTQIRAYFLRRFGLTI